VEFENLPQACFRNVSVVFTRILCVFTSSPNLIERYNVTKKAFIDLPYPVANKPNVVGADFSPDCQTMVTATTVDHKILVYNTKDGSLRTSIDTPGKFSSAIKFVDNRLVVVGRNDGDAQLWDVIDKKLIQHFPTGPLQQTATGDVISVLHIEGVVYIAIANKKQEISIWVKREIFIQKVLLFQSSEVIVCLRIGPGYDTLTATTVRGLCYVWKFSDIAYSVAPKVAKTIYFPGGQLLHNTFLKNGEGVLVGKATGPNPWQKLALFVKAKNNFKFQ